MKVDAENYTRMQVPGLTGVYFRDQCLALPNRQLKIYSASAADVLSAPRSRVAGPDLPYWCVAWPSGIALARYLTSQAIAGARILEIGSGVGVASLGALLAGGEVVASDIEPHALRLASMNARRNNLQLRSIVADWRAWPIRGQFDLIIGSDVTYQPAAFPSLTTLINNCLTPNGDVWLTDPGRLTMTVFQRVALEAGWRWEAKSLPPEGPQSVFLYRLRR